MSIVHHHLIFQGNVNIIQDSITEINLKKFMKDLLSLLNMNVLIEPQFKLSKQRAWTGIMGIITSHISFHYWIDERYLQLDIYSCKQFDKEKAITFIKNFWKSNEGKVLFIDRKPKEDFIIEKINFTP